MGQRCLIFLLLLLPMPSLAFAQVSDTFTTRIYRGRSVLQVSYSLDMSGSMSLGAVKVVVKDSKGASTADRNLVLMLYIKHYGSGAAPVAYRYPLKLAEGQAVAQVEIPFVGAGSQLSWDVGIFEDGRDIEDTRKRPPNQATYQWLYNVNVNQQSFPVAGLLASDAVQGVEAKNVSIVAGMTNQPAATQTYTAPGMIATNAVASPNVLSVGDASEDWRRYFSYSIWIASQSAIAEINQRRPQVARALRTYISAGGNLLIYDVQSPSSLQEVNQLLGFSEDQTDVAPWKSLTNIKSPWWTISENELVKRRQSSKTQSPAQSPTDANLDAGGLLFDTALLTETLVESEWGTHRGNLLRAADLFGFTDTVVFPGVDAEHSPFFSLREDVFSQLATEQILHRPYLRGRVLIASKPLHELPDGLLDKVIKHSKLESGWQMTNHDFDGNWFWRNLIASVGKPPIWAFCAMVTLFGGLLGPGLLYFTGRLQRRSLMIFFVPVISFMATLLIITYGILHEGFETNIRISSVTAYDPSAQVAFAWSRQNYFSGLPPREGLEFPIEAYVRSVHATEVRNRHGSPDPREGVRCVVDVGEQQHWRGWLRPRQHQQLLVGHPVDAASIPISTATGEDGGLLLSNLTSMTLPLVVLRDGKENYFTAVDLGPLETRECQAMEKSGAAAIVGRLGSEIKPRIPIEMEGSSGNLLSFGRNGSYTTNSQAIVTEIINSVYERVLTDKLELEPFEFATLVPEFEPIIIPVKGKQANNVNLVIGVDPW